MSSQRYILQCLPLLASVLGNQYGVQVKIQGDEAKTNGKIIYIPAMPTDCDADMLGLVRGYIDHESAHVRYSNFQALNAANLDSVTKWLVNAIEDWRVERELANSYPGCRQNMRWLAKKLFVEGDESEAGVSTPASDVLRYVLLKVRSWDVPEINSVWQPLRMELADTFGTLIDEIDPVLHGLQNDCPDTCATIVHARHLADIIRKWESQNPDTTQTKPSKPPNKGDTTQEAENDQNQTSNAGDNEEENAQNSIGPELPSKFHNQPDRDKQEDSAQMQTQGADTTPVENARQQIEALFDMADDELPKNMGEILASEIGKIEGSGTDDGLVVAEEARYSLSPLPDDEKMDVLKSSAALRTRLQGLLQATNQSHCVPGRTGKLNTGKLYRLNVGNPKIFQSQSERRTLNTAVHILLDASQSMSGERIKLANQACYAIAHVLKQIRGINPAITAFQGNSGPEAIPVLRHGQPLLRFGKAAPDGNTPLAAALWWVLQQMVVLKETRKLLLIISDGSPNLNDPYAKALVAARQIGVEVYGLGVQSVCIEDILPKTSLTIESLPALATTVFGILSKALTRERI